MRKGRPRRTLKKPFKIILAVAGAVLFIVLVVLVFKPKSQHEITTSTVSLSYNTQAIIIRNETNFYAPFDYGRVLFSVNEGSTVHENQEIGTIYKLGYTDDTAQNLYTIQQDIYEMQLSLLSGISQPELDNIESDISQIKDELQNAYLNREHNNIKSIETRLLDAIAKRRSALKTMIQPTEELNRLYSEEETAQKRLDEWTSPLATDATQKGTFSAYHDGLEQSLCMSKINSITVSQFNQALKSDGYSTLINDDNFTYRLIDESCFCVAFTIEDSSLSRIYKDESYDVKIAGIAQTYTGKCIKTLHSGKTMLYVIELKGDMKELTCVRNVDITVLKSATGSCVKLSAVSVKDGKAYVELAGEAKSERIEVDVLASDKKYAIIRPSNGANTLLPGQWYSTRKD